MNRYQNIPQTKIDKKLVYVTSRYPEVPVTSDDVYVYTVQGDRFDVLAQQYYKDSSLWWVISIANTNQLPQNSLVIPEGLQIRIPAFYAGVINAFNRINS
jgi:phage tail protein X